MARVELAPGVADDIDRIIDHLRLHESDDLASRVRPVMDAVEVLETNPLIGRPAPRSMRELVIGSGSRGYVALYRYVPEIDTIFVLALRSQREAGYRHE